MAHPSSLGRREVNAAFTQAQPSPDPGWVESRLLLRVPCDQRREWRSPFRSRRQSSCRRRCERWFMLTAVSRCRHAEQADASAVHGAWPRDKEQRTVSLVRHPRGRWFCGRACSGTASASLRGDNEAGVVDDDPRGCSRRRSLGPDRSGSAPAVLACPRSAAQKHYGCASHIPHGCRACAGRTKRTSRREV